MDFIFVARIRAWIFPFDGADSSRILAWIFRGFFQPIVPCPKESTQNPRRDPHQIHANVKIFSVVFLGARRCNWMQAFPCCRKFDISC